MFFINWSYIIFMLPFYIFTLIASIMVKSRFRHYSSVHSSKGITGEEAARRVLDANGLYDVRIEKIAGELTDHYDPRSNVIRLSTSVFDSTSTAAIGVACHEVGHAIQFNKGYLPIKIRNAIIPITNIGSTLSMPLIILGILLSTLGSGYAMIAYIGVILFGLCVLFQLVTLPVEFNASKRSISSLKEMSILSSDELVGAKKVLSAAALTYVAALAASIGQLLYLIRLVGLFNRD